MSSSSRPRAHESGPACGHADRLAARASGAWAWAWDLVRPIVMRNGVRQTARGPLFFEHLAPRAEVFFS